MTPEEEKAFRAGWQAGWAAGYNSFPGPVPEEETVDGALKLYEQALNKDEIGLKACEAELSGAQPSEAEQSIA